MRRRWQDMGSLTPAEGSIPASREGGLPSTLTRCRVPGFSLK
jgi:hypothetical protein